METKEIFVHSETIKKFISKNCIKVLDKEEGGFLVEFRSPFKSLTVEKLIEGANSLWNNRVKETHNLNPSWIKELSEIITLSEEKAVELLSTE
jgi:hypothetical protein